jgi:imidazolonepropionase-like amidohydrolase
MAALLFRGARVFDGEAARDSRDVLVAGSTIAEVDGRIEAPSGAQVVEAGGKTLLPGLIDAHTHTKPPALEMALSFGVTTELDMFSDPAWMTGQRREAQIRNDMADVRSAMIGASLGGGHPSALVGPYFDRQYPVLESPGHAPAFVAERVAEWIKLVIEDGTALGIPSPTLTDDMVRAVIEAAHQQGKMTVAHTTCVHSALGAVRAGIDGLVHAFADERASDDAIAEIAASGVFVVSTLTTMASIHGEQHGTHLAADERARPLISDDWAENLCHDWNFPSPGSLANAVDCIQRLYAAGVDILAGTDATVVGVPGTAHGVSMHGELELLVDSGLSPAAALRAATSLVAQRFSLPDRGRIAPGLQADLLLVNGDPTTDIRDSLSIEGVWRRGEQAPRLATNGADRSGHR